MALYDDGTLLAEANRLTCISGNGRLKHWDGSFVDLGASTGGYPRTVLHDWNPSDLTQFEPVDPAGVEPRRLGRLRARRRNRRRACRRRVRATLHSSPTELVLVNLGLTRGGASGNSIVIVIVIVAVVIIIIGILVMLVIIIIILIARSMIIVIS